MKLILKKGQMLEELFSPSTRSKAFPAPAFGAFGKKLNAQKFVGVISPTGSPSQNQNDLHHERNQDPD